MPEVALLSRDEGKENFRKLYPELDAQTLAEVLRLCLRATAPQIVVNDGVFGGVVSFGKRRSQIFLASQDRLFTCDLWEDGVCLGNAHATTLEELAEFFELALVENLSMSLLSETSPTFSFHDAAIAYEKSAESYITHQWKQLISSWENDHPKSFGIPELLRDAQKHPILGSLFPFTSLSRICFSRCTGYPFSSDCPFVIQRKDGLYVVRRAEDLYAGFNNQEKSEPLGVGDVAQAIEILVSALPPNCGPAILGTRDDLEDGK